MLYWLLSTLSHTTDLLVQNLEHFVMPGSVLYSPRKTAVTVKVCSETGPF